MITRTPLVMVVAWIVGLAAVRAPVADAAHAVVRNRAPEMPASASSATWPVHYPGTLRDKSSSADPADTMLRRLLNLHMASRYEDALAVADDLCRIAPDHAIAHYNRACVLARLHRSDPALDAIDRAITLGWDNRVHLEVDPDLALLRDHPRFRVAMERVGGATRSDAATVARLRKLLPTLYGEAASPIVVGSVREGSMRWLRRFDRAPIGPRRRHDLPPDLLLFVAAGRFGVERAPAPETQLEHAFASRPLAWRQRLGERLATEGTTIERYCRAEIIDALPAPDTLTLRSVAPTSGTLRRLRGSAGGLGQLLALATRERALVGGSETLWHESADNGCLVRWSADGTEAVFVICPRGGRDAAQKIATLVIGR
ncbi:MAG: hypothetical protein HKO59_06055 [Phycisphaerales bacterium]|nr:hypothetical protein [Phycisphaerae bacterium]NNF43365.1 hypothetical protein [Phycisphaerales bacterium]NNM25536.1 hypothetical protein [Phycisphaerales bacterium]